MRGGSQRASLERIIQTEIVPFTQNLQLQQGGNYANLAGHLGIHVSPTTLLRRVMALPTAPPGPVSIPGIDDWSFRRGRKFGPILVDLQAHQVIELLPDRKTETAAAWMHTHDEIEIVSRDRGEDYAAAARLGAPQARQVADRFHITKIWWKSSRWFWPVVVRRSVEPLNQSRCKRLLFLLRSRRCLQRLTGVLCIHTVRNTPVLPIMQSGTTAINRCWFFARKRLTSKDIARRLGMKDRTVRHWRKLGIPAEVRRRRKRSSVFDLYAAYVLKQWQDGHRNGLHLFEELQG
jgi:hypothetical protein